MEQGGKFVKVQGEIPGETDIRSAREVKRKDREVCDWLCIAQETRYHRPDGFNPPQPDYGNTA